jgi:hypothetical protein
LMEGFGSIFLHREFEQIIISPLALFLWRGPGLLLEEYQH